MTRRSSSGPAKPSVLRRMRRATPRADARISARRWRRARPTGPARFTATDRGGLRLGEDGGALLEDPASRPGPGGLAVHPGACSLRPDPPAEALESCRMTAGTRRRAVVGRPVTVAPTPARLSVRSSAPLRRNPPPRSLRRNRPERQVHADRAHKNPDLPRSSAACKVGLENAAVDELLSRGARSRKCRKDPE